MADPAPARAARPRARLARPRLAALAALALGLMALAPSVAVAAPAFRVWTPYPAVTTAPGTRLSLDIDLTTPTPQRVDLALSGVPSGWTATLHGGGLVVSSAYTDGTSTPTTVRLDVSIPATASGTSTLTVTATAGSVTQTLPIDVTVQAGAGGDVTLATDFPSLRGPAGQTFTFNLTLVNNTAQDLDFTANGQGPAGWTVNTTLTGQSQAASTVVKAGATSGITVAVTPADGVAAGQYEIDVVATAGAKQLPVKLQVEITGSYSLKLSTPDGRLNGSGSAGSASDMSFTVTNSGTSAVTNVKLSASTPTGWKVTFDTPTIDSIAPNETKTVVGHVTPSGDAVAGDYDLTFSAAGDQASSSSVDIRFTVQTSLLWAVVGIALIAGVVVGLWWVFQRYGRR